ncbi:MAG: PD40 domain-containing protein [Chitinophagales bacterium]|nr:PD40 domain-containing protein [Chitinophagales bacterium]
MRINRQRFVLLGVALISSAFASAQEYFGQNKVKYDQFEWAVFNTPHFQIYYYEEEKDAVKDVAQISEIWYDRLSKIFRHQFSELNPLILYASPEHFQQTDIIPGLIGEGIGGVTEGNKNRVIIPLVGSWQDNNHVIGHELVHAFQYDILTHGDSTSIRNIGNLPLWFIEGLAEYLSIGTYDPNTTMWLRDAVMNDKFPSLRKMTNDYHYFPYRWGQAFWAYATGIKGDNIIPELFKECAIYGYERGIERVFDIKSKEFSKRWKETVESYYRPYINSPSDEYSSGRRMFEDRKAINEQDFAPAVSPNGKYVVFLSARNVFSLDLFLADARSRKIIRRLKTETSNSHGNALRLIESAATWSPDSKNLAFVSYEAGRHYINIVEAVNGKTKEKFSIDDVQSLLNPSWSPDGKNIVFSGVNQGSSDLYLYDLKNKQTTRLTHDKFSDLQPSWSPDSRSIVFTTNRFSDTDFSKYVFGNYELATLDLQTHSLSEISLFADVNHINPLFGKDSLLYFIASPDGVSNIYRYNFKTSMVEGITHEKTATAGITALSPALSIATKTGDLFYSVFKGTGYQLYSLKMDKKLKAVPIDMNAVSNREAGELLPIDRISGSSVNEYLESIPSSIYKDSVFSNLPYKPKLSLSSISNAGIGIGMSPYGAAYGGAVSLLFSDMLDQHLVYGAISSSGNILDIGGIVGYLNQKKRYSWGLSLSHTPYGAGSFISYYETVTVDGIPTTIYVLDQYIQRQFDDQLSVYASYPFTRVNRIEGSLSFDVVNYSYQLVKDQYLLNGFLLNEDQYKLDAPPGFQYGTASLALVGDDSRFGFTSPLDGYRYRMQAGATTGSFTFGTALADFRYYKYVKPLSFAFRAMHYGRYFGAADSSIISPLTVGNDAFVRGYNFYSYNPSEVTYDASGNSIEINNLFGSKLGVVNFEIRFPLTGPREIAPIKSLALPSTISLFFDGGIAWTGSETPKLMWTDNQLERTPIFSTGLSLRVNIFGYLVAEGFYAIPFQRPAHASLTKGVVGLLLYPGW